MHFALDKNKRKYPRVEVEITADLNGASDRDTFTTATKNIGAGGVCVNIEQALPVDSRVRVSLKLPDAGPPLENLGRVIWSESQRHLIKRKKKAVFDIGIEFVDLEPAQRERLIRFTQDYLF